MEYEPATGIYMLNLTTHQYKFQIPKQKIIIERNVCSVFNTVKRYDTQFTVMYNRKQITTRKT